MINYAGVWLGCRQYFFVCKKGFWGGLAMAAPFYAEFFSWFWAASLALPLLFLVVRRGRLSVPHAAILPMLGLLLLHVVALGYSETKFEFQVIKDLITASFVLLIYFIADEDTSSGFFFALIPLAVFTALIGLVKAALLDMGYFLEFIVNGCHYYPAGSALCVNYNNLGLLWLVAALGCLKNRWWLLLPILIAAGLLSSSRRFIVLVCFLPVVWVVLQGAPVIAKTLIVALVVFFTIHMVTGPVSFDQYPFLKVIYESIGARDIQKLAEISSAYPSVMLGTMTDGTLGAASRLDFWQLGFSNLGWIPQGWRYHEEFSCAFSSCTDFHYPHMSIMSEWIIGGFIFGIIAIMFYAWPAWLVWNRKSPVHIALLVLAAPYSLLSGDTVFSLPIYISCMLVALSSVPRKMRISP